MDVDMCTVVQPLFTLHKQLTISVSLQYKWNEHSSRILSRLWGSKMHVLRCSQTVTIAGCKEFTLLATNPYPLNIRHPYDNLLLRDRSFMLFEVRLEFYLPFSWCPILVYRTCQCQISAIRNGGKSAMRRMFEEYKSDIIIYVERRIIRFSFLM
jgi:hypothetical protein